MRRSVAAPKQRDQQLIDRLLSAPDRQPSFIGSGDEQGDPFFGIVQARWLRDTLPGVTELVEIDVAKLFVPDERADELLPHLLRHRDTGAVNAR